jgi:hypothetical protein
MNNFLMGDGGTPMDDKQFSEAQKREKKRDWNEAHIPQLKKQHPIQNSFIQLLPQVMQDNYWRNYGVSSANPYIQSLPNNFLYDDNRVAYNRGFDNFYSRALGETDAQHAQRLQNELPQDVMMYQRYNMAYPDFLGRPMAEQQLQHIQDKEQAIRDLRGV